MTRFIKPYSFSFNFQNSLTLNIPINEINISESITSRRITQFIQSVDIWWIISIRSQISNAWACSTTTPNSLADWNDHWPKNGKCVTNGMDKIVGYARDVLYSTAMIPSNEQVQYKTYNTSYNAERTQLIVEDTNHWNLQRKGTRIPKTRIRDRKYRLRHHHLCSHLPKYY